MSSFLHTDALLHIEKHLDRFPLIKLDRILDWTPIEQYLTGRKTRYVRDNGGRPAYPLLSMFKAILLGQWHSLSDPELEYSLLPAQAPFARFNQSAVGSATAQAGQLSANQHPQADARLRKRFLKPKYRLHLQGRPIVRLGEDGFSELHRPRCLFTLNCRNGFVGFLLSSAVHRRLIAQLR